VLLIVINIVVVKMWIGSSMLSNGSCIKHRGR
jgi:hypothetical protein